MPLLDIGIWNQYKSLSTVDKYIGEDGQERRILVLKGWNCGDKHDEGNASKDVSGRGKGGRIGWAKQVGNKM